MYKWIVILLLQPMSLLAQTITTIAGTGIAGFSGDGGAANTAQLNGPTDVYKDFFGNIYIADNQNHRIRKINTSGIISTIAGNGIAAYSGDDGEATNASLNRPNSVAVDIAGNVYVADMGNNVIRKINPIGIISGIAGNGIGGFSGDGGQATNANISNPSGVAIDLIGNIYIADKGNSRIRKVDTSGIITTIAGGGTVSFIQPGGYCVDGVPATSVKLCIQNDVSVDYAGTVYITNYTCWHFSKITPDGILYNVAGDYQPDFSANCGPATQSNVYCPYGIYPDNLGNIYLCPMCNVQVRKVNTTKFIITVAGNGTSGYTGDGGISTDATVSDYIYGIYADTNRDVYFADVGNNVIRHFKSIQDDTFYKSTCTESSIFLGNDKGGNWKSNNILLASVSDSGLVSPHSPGTVSIVHKKSDPCAGQEVYILKIEECSVGLPTAFSPNGDGKNDIFQVRGSGIKKIDLKIFNRFGQLVFETQDLSTGWDGTFNGHGSAADVYGYILIATYDGYNRIIKGNVTLLR